MKSALDFLVIGAQKSGTTSLFEHLKGHPEIFLPDQKEAAYFSHDRQWEAGWPSYGQRYFGAAPPDVLWGTVSPSYMVGGVYSRDPEEARSRHEASDVRTVPNRIAAGNPKIRLVAVLRDPVERAVSHHQMMMLNGEETRDLDHAIEELLHPDVQEVARRYPAETQGYVAWGEYGRILAGYYSTFASDQILVTFLDDLADYPGTVLTEVQAHIGVRKTRLPANLGQRYRVGGDARKIRGLSVNAWVSGLAKSGRARRLWHLLPSGGREAVSGRVSRLAYRADLWNRRSPTSGSDAKPSSETLARLRLHFADDTTQLEALIGHTPPWATKPRHSNGAKSVADRQR